MLPGFDPRVIFAITAIPSAPHPADSPEHPRPRTAAGSGPPALGSPRASTGSDSTPPAPDPPGSSPTPAPHPPPGCPHQAVPGLVPEPRLRAVARRRPPSTPGARPQSTTTTPAGSAVPPPPAAHQHPASEGPAQHRLVPGPVRREAAPRAAPPTGSQTPKGPCPARLNDVRTSPTGPPFRDPAKGSRPALRRSKGIDRNGNTWQRGTSGAPGFPLRTIISNISVSAPRRRRITARWNGGRGGVLGLTDAGEQSQGQDTTTHRLQRSGRRSRPWVSTEQRQPRAPRAITADPGVSGYALR